MSYHLVFADGHVAPGENMDRFDWLGRMILEERPKEVINIGDMGTLDSCSYHPCNANDRPTLREDFDAMKEAQTRMWSPLAEWNRRQRSHRHRQWEPKRIMLLGNHEDRFNRRAQDDPDRLGSVVDFDDESGISLHWDQVYEYGDYYISDGVGYTHTPMNRMGRPRTGVHRGLHIARDIQHHLVYGHTHTMDMTVLPLHAQENAARMVLNAPAFMPHQHVESYAKNSQTGWMYGLLRIRPSSEPNVPFSFDYLSMKDLERLYG